MPTEMGMYSKLKLEPRTPRSHVLIQFKCLLPSSSQVQLIDGLLKRNEEPDESFAGRILKCPNGSNGTNIGKVMGCSCSGCVRNTCKLPKQIEFSACDTKQVVGFSAELSQISKAILFA
uniref:Uncharacterized protein n=1 Tax=Glossina austeni TaxID=7395 RepID=A0A1A9V019_GLOAU